MKKTAKTDNSSDPKTLCHNILSTICILTLATVLAFSFFHITRSDPANIALIYILALIIIARITSGYVFGIISALFCVIFINWCFTYPYFKVNFQISGYPVTFVFLLSISLIISTLTTQLKKQDKMILERERAINEADKERIRANLLRAISHDLRTPLTSIIGSSDSFIENYQNLTDPEKQSLVSSINEDSHWLLNMVENLLSITRIDNETAKVTKSLEAVDEVASAAVIRFRKRFPNAVVRVKVPDELVMVMMDAMLIQQVILNILQNAQLHAKSTKPLELTIDEDEDYVYFHIRDYGVGIDETRIATIFDGDSYHETTGETDGYKGMGIGLSICKTIITAHDGTIIAKNHSEGVEFCFSLPKEKEDEKDVSEDISTDY